LSGAVAPIICGCDRARESGGFFVDVASVGGCLFSEVASIMAAMAIMTLIMLYEMIMLLIMPSHKRGSEENGEAGVCLFMAGRVAGDVLQLQHLLQLNAFLPSLPMRTATFVAVVFQLRHLAQLLYERAEQCPFQCSRLCGLAGWRRGAVEERPKAARKTSGGFSTEIPAP
jgi:hypothetical protein